VPDPAEIDQLVAAHSERQRMRKYLRDAYGPTRRLPHDLENEVIPYGVSSEKAAYCYADAEWTLYGNSARVELRESVGWVVVVDLRPQIERHRREREEQVRMRTSSA
jgi:hypothetical protein